MARPNRVKAFIASLTGRMLLGMLVIHALLVPLLFSGVIFFIKEGYQAQFIQQVRSNSQLLAALFAEEMAQTPPEQLLANTLSSGQVIFAQIITLGGQTVNAKTATNFYPSEFREDFFFGQHQDTIYYISVPLQGNSGNVNGALRLGYDEVSTQEQIQIAYQRGLYLALTYSLL